MTGPTIAQKDEPVIARPADVAEPLQGEEGPEDDHHHPEGDADGAPHLSSRLRILPVAVIGRASTNSTMRGYL